MRDLMPFIEALQALPEGENFGEDWMDIKDVTRLLQEHRINVNEFWILDETPGRYGYDPNGSGRGWHWKLRRWRNHPTTDFTFDTSKRCRNCGAFMERNPATNRLRCPAVSSHLSIGGLI